MLIRSRKPWDVIDYKTTDETVYLNRRSLLRAMGIAGAGLASASIVGGSFAPLVSSARAASITGFPATRNPAFTLDRPVTVEEEATTYTNFYEFGSSKNIWRKAQKLVTEPWIFTIEGLVDNPLQLDASPAAIGCFRTYRQNGATGRTALSTSVCRGLGDGCSLDRRADVASC